MSVYENKRPIDQPTRQYLSDEIRGFSAEKAQAYFAHFNERYSSETFLVAQKALDQFMSAVYEKANTRDFFTTEERVQHIANLTEVLQAYFNATQQSDQALLSEFIEHDPLEQKSILEDLAEYIADLKIELEKTADILGKKSISEELKRAQEEKNYYKQEIGAGKLVDQAVFSQEERHRHSQHVEKFNQVYQEDFDAGLIATEIVDQYQKKVVVYKIMLGLEAKYSDEEILAHLKSVRPEEDEQKLKEAVIILKQEYQEGKPMPHSTFMVFKEVLRYVFGDAKAATATFTASAALLGGVAPLTSIFVGETLRTNDAAGGYLAASSFAVSELGGGLWEAAFNEFIYKRIYKESGMAQKICAAIIESSPDLFTKTDHALLRQYIVDTLSSLETLNKEIISALGLNLSKIIGLSASLAFRLQDPALFVSVLGVTAINFIIAMKKGRDISEADQKVRVESANFLGVLDEAMFLKKTREGAMGPKEQESHRIYLAKSAWNKTMAKYQALGAFVLPALLAANTAILNGRPDLGASLMESTVVSNQLTAELNQFLERLGSFSWKLRPIVELGNIRLQFMERGEIAPENWHLELHDVKRKSLQVSYLEINPGDMAVVVGETGAGKSTLLEALYGLENERGVLMVDDIMPKDLDRKFYRSGIFLSNQFYPAETKSLKDNVVGNLEYREEVFLGLLKEHGFDRWLAQIQKIKGTNSDRPHEEMIINRDIDSISGGQKKMLSFLTLDYRLKIDPDSVKVILLDEPTSGVDAMLQPVVFSIINKWRKEFPQKIIVIVNHDQNLFDDLDPETTRILGIEKSGKLVQDETLASARSDVEKPFGKLFGGKITGA